MTKLMCGAVLALCLGAITPVAAQGIYVGPNGVGVDPGARPYDRYHERDYYRDHRRDPEEGRSAYEHRDYRDRGDE